jgi:hypothetical protein
MRRRRLASPLASDPPGAASIPAPATGLAVLAVVMFRRKPVPVPVYAAELWAEQHLLWPVERSLLAAFPDLDNWNRRPRILVPRDYKDPGTAGVMFWVPPWWHLIGEVRKTVVSIISSRLGIADPGGQLDRVRHPTQRDDRAQPETTGAGASGPRSAMLWPQRRLQRRF